MCMCSLSRECIFNVIRVCVVCMCVCVYFHMYTYACLVVERKSRQGLPITLCNSFNTVKQPSAINQ